LSARRLVIANRGEIARRILRAGRAMGFQVAVLGTPQDAGARVLAEADAVLPVPGFLDGPAIVAACAAWGGQLLHPGYGFLSENADFAQAVEDAGIRFVGPTAASMRALGRKEAAKELARACAVPVLEALLSHELEHLDPARWEAELAARAIHPPYLVKASGGGGGRGMRVVGTAGALPEAVRRAGQEAQAAFRDGAVFIERYLTAPRHIEIQVFGDGRGGGVSLGERECSLQRRHQKVLEEAPSAVVDPNLRARLGQAALALVQATRYRGAGTVEFLLDPSGAWYFLEVNARLQVEHPVTELAYRVDLVQAQLELAEGRWPAALGEPGSGRAPEPVGVALEARILAEDPRRDWLPTPGPVLLYREPTGPGIRVDSAVGQGDRINAAFDSLIAKLVVWGPDRATAVARLSQALAQFVILGCGSNLPLLQAISRSPDFLAGRSSTRWIQDHLAELNGPLLPAPWLELFASQPFREALGCALLGTGRPRGPAARFATLCAAELEHGGRTGPPFTLRPAAEAQAFILGGPGPEQEAWACRLADGQLALSTQGEVLYLPDPLAPAPEADPQAGGGPLLAPMAGRVVEVAACAGSLVEPGQLLFVLESMKMQFEVRAPRRARVEAVLVRPEQVLQGPERLALLGPVQEAVGRD